MTFQFCCPQGHLLQGDPSQVGQLFQCPICGGNFLIPPPETSQAPPGGFLQGPPSDRLQSSPGEFLQGALDLGFDPRAKESLPFDIPGENDGPVPSVPAAGITPSSFPSLSFPAAPFPDSAPPETAYSAPLVPVYSAPLVPVTFSPTAGTQDLLQSAPPATEKESPWQDPPNTLHIRCPSGHLVTARSDLLGKIGRCPACKQTFELRYEDSIEFQRRKEKIIEREEVKSGKATLAWAFLALFLVIVGLIVLMFLLSR